MKKTIFIAVAMLASSIAFAQQKKEKQPPPPPPPPVLDVKDIPPPPPKPKKDHDAILKRNPTVKGIAWSNDTVRIRLKSGKEEIYNMKKREDVQKLKSKYGELPAPPPPPPPPKTPPKPKKDDDVFLKRNQTVTGIVVR